MTKTIITLVLDEDDNRDFQAEIARRQAESRIADPDDPRRTVPNLPEGDSNLLGAMVGEIIRDLNATVWKY